MRIIQVLYKRMKNAVDVRSAIPFAPKKLFLWLRTRGEMYSQINKGKCVRYYRCIKVCPINAM